MILKDFIRLKPKKLKASFSGTFALNMQMNLCLQKAHSKMVGRYNVAKLFAALYLGFDRQTCEAEISSGIAAGVPFKTGAFTVWQYKTNLQEVLRLDKDDTLNEIGITSLDITKLGDHWTASGIGEHIHNRGSEGIVA
ncbi:MAG: hypothetical protein K2X81_03330 [Candidatus Obscuribacterales bacterium]|nr:hypothetical protein [Candidatus Obscuribacterales bacterium]